MDIPSGFYYGDTQTSKSNYVMRLKKNLYGLKQAAMNWYYKLRDGLIERGFKE